MAKAEHMLAILMLLNGRGKMTARQLAEELEIHIRTVYRCIDALCTSGVPIVSETGRDGGYSIPEHVKLAPLFFDIAEQKALLHAAQFARDSGYPYEAALNRAITKIKQYADSEQSKRLKAQEEHIEVVHPPTSADLVAKLAEIEKAIESQSSLEVNYHNDYEGSFTKRRLDPYGLVNWKEKWYVVGYCHLRGEIRSFRVDRISRIRFTDTRFERPASFSARRFQLESLIPESGTLSEAFLVSVHIQGLPQALDDLCGHWLFSRALVERNLSHAHFKMDELSLYLHTPYYLLSFGSKIRIIEPPELRACLAEIAESLHHYYRN